MIVATRPLYLSGPKVVQPGSILSGQAEFTPEQLAELVRKGSAKDIPVASPEILAQVRQDYETGLYDLGDVKREMRLPGLTREEPGPAPVRRPEAFTREELEKVAQTDPWVRANVAFANAQPGLKQTPNRQQTGHSEPPRISPGH
jgi:hypothetical protein